MSVLERWTYWRGVPFGKMPVSRIFVRQRVSILGTGGDCIGEVSALAS